MKLKLAFLFSAAFAIATAQTVLVAPVVYLGGAGMFSSGEVWTANFHFVGPGVFTPAFYSTAGAFAMYAPSTGKPSQLTVFGSADWNGESMVLSKGQTFDGSLSGICYPPNCISEITGAYNAAHPAIAWGTVTVDGAPNPKEQVSLTLSGFGTDGFQSDPHPLALFLASELSSKWGTTLTGSGTVGLLNFSPKDAQVQLTFRPADGGAPALSTVFVPAWGAVQQDMTGTGVVVAQFPAAGAVFQSVTTGPNIDDLQRVPVVAVPIP